MKCPLHTQVHLTGGKFTVIGSIECLKEECAQWDKVGNQCNELSKTHELSLIRQLLKDIRDKMPHAGQLTRRGDIE